MTSLSTKCPFCRRRYQQAAAYEKHLETLHHDILLSLYAIVDTTLPGLRAFAPDENSGQCYSGYESNLMLEIAACYTASNDPGDDMQHHSDEEDYSQPPDRGAHPVKKLFQALVEYSAMLLAIQDLIRP